MNILLSITMPFGGYTNRVIVKNLSDLSGAIEASDFRGRIHLKEDSRINNQAVRRIAAIMNGEVKPCRSFLAGNDYFGHVRFEYVRPDLRHEEPRTFFLSVRVFSALGNTLDEHDARYKTIKSIKFNSVRREYSQDSV